MHLWEGTVPYRSAHAPECLAILDKLRNRNLVVLTTHNEHARSLKGRLPGFGSYHEGSNHDPASATLEAVVAGEGDPAALSMLLVRAMREWVRA